MGEPMGLQDMFFGTMAGAAIVALEGSTWSGYFLARVSPWFVQAMHWRMVFGLMMTVGIVLLFWDMLTIGRTEKRAIQVLSPAPA